MPRRSPGPTPTAWAESGVAVCVHGRGGRGVGGLWCVGGGRSGVCPGRLRGAEEVTFSVPELGVRVSDPAREELASALRMSVGSMANRIAGARDLVAHPHLVELVASATLSAWAARLVVREVEDLTAGQAAAVVGQVCATLGQPACVGAAVLDLGRGRAGSTPGAPAGLPRGRPGGPAAGVRRPAGPGAAGAQRDGHPGGGLGCHRRASDPPAVVRDRHRAGRPGRSADPRPDPRRCPGRCAAWW